MLKQFSKSFLSCLLAVIMVVTLMAIPSSAATIKLNRSSMALTKGYCTTLKVSGTSKAVTWSTGDKTIATVSSSGKVIGKSLGSTYIYAKVSGKTLKCKVRVVAGKITADEDEISLEEGEKTTVRIKAIGTHTISAKSTNRKVVKATWSGAKFSGDYINLTLTGIGEGEARVKVYAKYYSSTVYKYIDVTVGESGLSDDDDYDDNYYNNSITPSQTSVTLAEGQTATIKVYCSNPRTLLVSSGNRYFATAVIENRFTKYITVNITGVSAGNTTVKVYNGNNSSESATISVKVSSQAYGYYKISTIAPSPLTSTDTIINFQDSYGRTKYMLVPHGYDSAEVNSLIAKDIGYYSYYKLYTNVPSRRKSTDLTKSVQTYFGNKLVTRYVLLPQNYDEPQLNTELAKYIGSYEYYKIYTSSPTRIIYSDEIITWTKDISLDGKIQKSTRYLLIPLGMSDSDIVKKIQEDDAGFASTIYYQPLTTLPSSIEVGDSIFTWVNPKSNTTKYMILPANYNFVKRNDAIYSDTGVYCYFTVYSTKPTVKDSTREQVVPISVLAGNSTVSGYMLIDTKDKNAEALRVSGINGSYNYYPQS